METHDRAVVWSLALVFTLDALAALILSVWR